MSLPKKLWSLKDKLKEIAKKEKVEKLKKTKDKKTMKSIKSKAKSLAILLLGVALIGGTVMAYNGTPKVVVEGDYIEAQSQEQSLGAFPGPDIYQDLVVYGTLRNNISTEAFAPTATTSDTTLRLEDSGKTYLLSASGTTFTLPAVTAGANFKFVVNGALDSANVVIDSAEGDNIEGTLIVAGAVVDCAAEDQINFVTDGENIGDYVELYSDGSQWLIGDSGVLTSGKMTCTDPS